MMSTLFSARTILLLLAVALLNVFFFRMWDGLGWALLITMGYLLIVGTHWPEVKPHLTAKWFLLSSGGILLSAAVVLTRANDFVQSVSILTAGLLLITLWNSFQASQPGVHSFAELVMTPFTAIRNYVVGQARFAFSSRDLSKPATNKIPVSGNLIKSIIIGLIISIPLLAIVVSLLSAGDPIFQSTLQQMFNWHWHMDPHIWQRLVLTALFLILLIPAVQRKLGTAFVSPLQGLSHFSFTTEFSVAVLLLVLVLGFFLVVQWPYIFVSVAAETDLSKFGVATYSEYVTRGFAELQIVSIIIYSVVWLGLVLFRANSRAVSAQRLKILQLILLSEFAIFLASQFRRVWLYQSIHGMTIVRAYGAYFILLVSMFTLTLAGRHLTSRAMRWVQVELAIIICSVLFLSVFNVENYLAVYHPPTVNGRVDYTYLARLGPDGSEGWKKALAHADQVLNDPSLDNKPIIVEDQRREIAYAGAIVKTLFTKRYGLLEDFGTQQEIKDFYLTSLNAADARYSRRIAQLLATDGAESTTASAMISEDERIRATATAISQLTDTAPIYTNAYSYSFFYSNDTACDSNHCFLDLMRWPTYTLIEHKIDPIEQTLRYNATAYNQYLLRDTVLPMDRLIMLENRYFELLNRINNQPENEREFDVDIDFSSPFIGVI